MRLSALLSCLLFTAFQSLAQPDFIGWKNDAACRLWVDSVYQSLSPEERIGQCFMLPVYADPKDKRYNVKEVQAQLQAGQAGSVIFFKGQPSVQQMWTNRFQQNCKLPVLTALDAEWGISMRLDSSIVYPHQLTLGAIRNNELIRKMGLQIGRECRRMGIQISFSPVIDINNNPNNPVINDRSFGEDKFRVTLKGFAYQEGLLQGGVLPCIKHFPGHGDTDQDSHHTLPVINKSRAGLDSLELYPFRLMVSEGAPAVMAAHLQVPALDSLNFTASSVSRKVVTELLRDSFGFKGLIFSDALNMKGVSNFFRKGQLDSLAFMAGNDILVFSEDAPSGIARIRAALDSGFLAESELQERVKRVLAYKYFLTDRGKAIWINSDELVSDLNSDTARGLCLDLFQAAITVPANAQSFFPLRPGANAGLAILSIGNGERTALQDHLSNYLDATMLQFPAYATAADYERLFDSISRTYKQVLISLHTMSRFASRNHGLYPQQTDFINRLAMRMPVGLLVFGSPYSLARFDSVQNIMLAYEDQELAQMAAANALVGAAEINGRLPVSAGKYRAGDGLMLEPRGLLQIGLPGQEGYTAYDLRDLDDIAREGIIANAFPGCQLLAVSGGKVIWHKAYGNLNYKGNLPVNHQTLYDIASITKLASTTLAVMKLYEEGKLRLEKTVADYLPEAGGSAVGRLNIKNILLHQAGLQAYIEFYKSTIHREGPLPRYYRRNPEGAFNIPVADSLYLREDYRDSVLMQIFQTRVSDKPGYVYSDLDFYLLWKMVERISAETIDEYVYKNFYSKMGLFRTVYRPLDRFPKERIAPTENDKSFRKQQLQGHVHDPGAAMMGGVAGHAGLFSNAFELGAIMQMLLQNGYYNGERLLDSLTVATFTARQSEISRRGLGFDKPEPDSKKVNPCAAQVSLSAFGHTGFTGTAAWADPEKKIIFIFLSNRIFPDVLNPLLNNKNIRPRMQEILYLKRRK